VEFSATVVERSAEQGRSMSAENSNMELDDNLKQLMKQLGMAINESLSESEPISDALANIRGAGYDVFLVLEATIGFNKRREEDAAEDLEGHFRAAVPSIQSGGLALTPQDAEFLKLLRISLGESKKG